MSDIYTREPLKIIDGIPLFSELDDYIINYDQIAEDHIATLSETGESPFMTAEQIRESEIQTRHAIRSNLKEGGRILDAGVGLGGLLSELDEFSCYGVDIAMPYLRFAKSTGIEVAMAKLEELPYEDEFFDAVVACDVLEHVFGLDLSVQQLTRTLKTGGVLIIRVPNEENLDPYLSEDQSYSHSHVRNFSLASPQAVYGAVFRVNFIEFKLCWLFL